MIDPVVVSISNAEVRPLHPSVLPLLHTLPYAVFPSLCSDDLEQLLPVRVRAGDRELRAASRETLLAIARVRAELCLRAPKREKLLDEVSGGYGEGGEAGRKTRRAGCAVIA